jgi:hypothetical protein
MNKTLRTIIVIFVVLIGATALVGTGFVIGRFAWGMGGYFPGGMMGFYNQDDQNSRFGYGMETGMMRGWGDDDGRFSYGMMGPGMMGGTGGYGMMGGYSDLENVDPLSVEETREVVESYLDSFGNDDLAIKEIMIFNNNAYAIIAEESTGTGAFELLIDPVTKAVFPEYGPNMMWNLKYGMMSGFGGYGMMGPGMMMGNSGYGRGGMMGGFGFDSDSNLSDVSAELSVSPEEALETAQRYLDQYFPGAKLTDEITTFYGYYALDFEKDGEIAGMLSVNSFTRQVFPHTWHGEFIEMVHKSDHD